MAYLENYTVKSTLLQQTITVGTSATLLPTSALPGRRNITIQNLSASGILYLGTSTVTSAGTTRGIALASQYASFQLDLGDTAKIYAVANTGTIDVAILEAY